MASSSGMPTFEYFKIYWPSEYVVHVEINRPQKMNAFVEPMWLELRVLFDTLSHSSSVRAIVLSGAGLRAFTTGLDVQFAGSSGVLAQNSSGASPDGARTATAIRRHISEFQDCITAVERCEKPVICVMHGYAFGLAVDLSTCADVRICSSDTRFAVKEVDIGLAADIGTLTRLPKVVGNYSWVKDVSLSARVFGPEEAFRVGFVSGVYPSKEAAVAEGIKWAELVASKSPVAVQGLRYTASWNGAYLQTQDVPLAMQANIKRRKPTFEKL